MTLRLNKANISHTECQCEPSEEKTIKKLHDKITSFGVSPVSGKNNDTVLAVLDKNVFFLAETNMYPKISTIEETIEVLHVSVFLFFSYFFYLLP